MRILLAAVALAAAAPAFSQSIPAPATPDEDLLCAAWAAVVMGLNKDDADVATAFSMALAWFVARYEGATGKPFEQAMTAEYLNGLTPELEAIENTCRPRMQEMGERFSAWGTTLQSADQ